MLTAKVCGRCRFRGLIRDPEIGDASPCYRFPPAPGVPPGQAERWPWVLDNDACGEFQPRESR